MNRITLTNLNTASSLYSSSAQLKNSPNQNNISPQKPDSTTGSVDITSTGMPAAAQTASTAGTGNSPAYSVEISQEGSRLNSLGTSAAVQSTAGESADTSAPLAAANNEASSQPSGSPAASSGSAETIYNLPLYSDYQLRQMLFDGNITQKEYTAELAKRINEKAETAPETSYSTINIRL